MKMEAVYTPARFADISGGQVEDEVSDVDAVGQLVAQPVKVLVCQLCTPIIQRMPLFASHENVRHRRKEAI